MLLEQRALLSLPREQTFVVAEVFKVGRKIGDRYVECNWLEFFLTFFSASPKEHVSRNADSRLDPVVHVRRQMDS